MDENKARYAQKTDARTLADIMPGADIFLGLSAGKVLKPEWLPMMADAAADPGARESRARDHAGPRQGGAAGRGHRHRPLGFPEPGQQRAVLSVHLPRRARRRRDDDQRGDEARHGARDSPISRWPSSRTSSRRPTASKTSALRSRIPDPEAVRSAAHRQRSRRRWRRRRWTPAWRRGRSPTSRRTAQRLLQFVYHSGLLMKPIFIAAKKEPKRIVYCGRRGRARAARRAGGGRRGAGEADPHRPPDGARAPDRALRAAPQGAASISR